MFRPNWDICVVSGPCWCSIFESLRVQMLWETWGFISPLGEKLLIALTQALHVWADYDDWSCSSSSCVALKGQEKERVDERKGDGKTTMPGRIQCLRHAKICFTAWSPGENRLVHVEKEAIRRNSLRISYSLFIYHTGYHAWISFVCFLKN